MEIVKITNVGLKNSSGTAIPCIRVVVKDYVGSYSSSEISEFQKEVYRRSIGLVTFCGVWGQRNDDHPFPTLSAGNYVVGDDTGFKLSTRAWVSGQQYYTRNTLYYQGVEHSRAYAATGYSHSEIAIGLIVTDEDYNLLTTNSPNLYHWSGPSYRGDYPGGVITPGDYHVCTIPDAETIYAMFQTDINLAASIVNIKEAITNEIDPSITDPYEAGGGSSETGGGTGTFSETGDIVGIPSLPTLSAVDTGFITLFNPTAAQVKQLASYMWSSGFDLDTFKNVVANPIDCILGLTIVPVDPSNAGTKAVTVGNIPTSVNMPYLASQYVEVDCGSLNVQEFWGSYLDYSPYTKMSLYLPYIGIVPLDIDDVMNATIAVKYHVDVLSGACVAYVLCNGTQLYTYIGQCSSNVPITSNDFTNTVNGILGIAGNIGSLVSSGGKMGSVISAAANIASNAINAVKPNVQKSGAMSGTGGLMGVQTPYLICQRPRQSVPASQNSFTGYPANITLKLGDLSGYTEVEKIHLEGVPCTNEEMDEIMQLLETGVYI